MTTISTRAYTIDQNQANSLLAANEAKQNDYPAYYEEDSSKSGPSTAMLGLTLLGVLGAAGIIYGAVQHKKVSGLKDKIKDVESAKDDINKQLDEVKKSLKSKEDELQAANKKIDELKKPAAPAEPVKKELKSFWSKLKFWKKK